MGDDDTALVPRDGRTDPRVRDDRGLLPAQVAWLKELAGCLDPRLASEKAGLDWRRVRRWMSTDKALQAAYEEVMSGVMEAFERESQMYADAAQDEAWELLKAMKPIKVVTPCEAALGGKHVTYVEVRDTAARIRLIELAMKLAGRLKDVRQHKFSGEIVHLTADQKVALMALKMGKEISEQMYEELENMGVIPRTTMKQTDDLNVVEGEAKPV